MNMASKISGFVKLEHTLFSLPLLFAGALLAVPVKALTSQHFGKIALIMLAGVGARTLALALNRLLDREIDAKNPRTKNREIPAGKLSVSQGWAVAAVGAILYLWAAWMLGPLCLKLSPIPVAVFVIYPLMKRFSFFAHFGVGLGLALAPLGGYVGMVDLLPTGAPIWLLSIFTLFWVAGFDILYAIDDMDFDRSEGLHSIPSKFGEAKAREISKSLHFICVILLAAMGAFLVTGVQPADANLFEQSFSALKKGFGNDPGLGRHIAMALAAAPSIILLFMQQKFSNSLEPGSTFFKVNAWTGVAVFVFVLVGAM